MLNFEIKSIHIVCLSVILCLLGNHHPSVEFDCGKAALIISRLFVYVCARMCVVHLSTCLVIANFHYGSAGGRAVLQRCNEINDPWFFRCDQETKLSSHCETKSADGAERGAQRTQAAAITSRTCRVSCQWGSQWGQQTHTTYPNVLHASELYVSLLAHRPIPCSRFPPESFCQMLPDSHICAENELYPRALWVKDSLVKNAVLLDEQTNVPCNVVALAFYATLKESINLHNSNEHVLPLWRHG